MKKNIKTLVGLGLALTMAVGATAVSFADSITMTGKVGKLEMKIKIPTANLVVNPYAANQVGSTEAVFEVEEGETGVGYKVTMLGYTATATPKSSSDTINLITKTDEDSGEVDIYAPGDYTDEKKTASLSIELGAAADEKPVAETNASKVYTDTEFGEVAGKVVCAKKSSADYSAKNTTYTKIEVTEEKPAPEVSIGEGQFAPIRVKGSMNAAATWVEGDTFTVVPVFKITPVLSEDTEASS